MEGTGRARGKRSGKLCFGERHVWGTDMAYGKVNNGKVNIGRKRRGRQRDRRGRRLKGMLFLGLVFLGVAAYIWKFPGKEKAEETPGELLCRYMNYIPEREYGKMYAMLDGETSGNISREDFISRNSAIYEGIELQNMQVEVTGYDEERLAVSYKTTFDTVAGAVSFANEATFQKGEEGYKLSWKDSLIFPSLSSTDRVRVSTVQAQRGEILDREGRMLAGPGTASSVGMVPGKLKDREAAVQVAARLLAVEPETIEKKLAARWVKEDSFVPVKTIPRADELALMLPEPDEEAAREMERHEKLLEIPGVMITDINVRTYPYGEAAAHLTGYVQNVTAEDLERHAGEGYTAASVIGKTGVEGLFERELKGQNGYSIYISDAGGNRKEELASVPVQNGQDVRLTIDIELQKSLYETFKEDKSCSVAMDPFTGEVMALVSTPAYDSKDFIMGFSKEKWAALNEDEMRPLYNRFRQAWCPGSTLKPVIAAIGLETGALDPERDYGNVGTRWQKDASWGSYYVTTLHAYEPVTLKNALVYSDNIYFARAALAIGDKELENALTELGFGGELPFEIGMSASRYSNTEHLETEIQLADSGYGQGQVLVNPLHLACLYSAFCNAGNVVKPRLLYEPGEKVEYWIPGAFSRETADMVRRDLIEVVEAPEGTARAVGRKDVVLAGKTGTAEIKDSKEDTSGTELGWLAVFTAEREAGRPVLLVTMVEDVKDRGGSRYVAEKDGKALESWFGENREPGENE